MTSYLNLLKTQKTFQVQTQEILQETYLANASEAWLIFETHIQIWDLDLGTRIARGKDLAGIFFYTIPALVNKETIAVVRLEDCKPNLETYNIGTGEVTTLGIFPENEQQNFTKLFYFEDTGNITVVAKGKESRLYHWNKDAKHAPDQVLPHTVYKEGDAFEKYNSRGTISSYPANNNSNTFDLIIDGKAKSYNLGAGIEAGIIRVIKEYSNTETVIALVHNEKESTIVLYNTETGVNLKVTKLTFPIDNVLKVGDNWIGIATVGEDDDESNVKVQVLFSDLETQIYIQQLPRAFRVWNDFFPILTVSYDHPNTEEKQQQIFTIVKSAPKRSIYTNFLEKAGVIEAFGKEIVKEVLNNFN